MTRHNLREHLSWLIVSTPSGPQQPAYAPPNVGATTGLELILDTSSPQLASSNPGTTSVENSARINDVQRHTQPHNFARPLVAASVLNAQDGNVMARLQSGPKASHKPRLLLSEAIPLSLQPPTPSSIRTFGKSLTDRYNAQWEQRASGANTPSKSRPHKHDLASPKICSSRSREKGLDLTRDDNHTSSSSTVDVFGDPRPLWREDSATRKEPPLPKGIKRKSDEYEEDELGASIAPRMSQSSFNDIDCFADEISLVRPEHSPAKPDRRIPVKRISTGGTSPLLLDAADQAFDDDLNSPSTLGKLAGQKASQTPKASVCNRLIKDDLFLKAEDQGCSTTRAIADSEDEDDEAEYKDRLHNVKKEYGQTDDSSLVASASTKEHDLGITKVESTQTNRSKAIEISTCDVQPAQNLAPAGASPFQRDSPTRLPHIGTFSQSQYLDNFLASSPLAQDRASSEDTQVFLRFEPCRVPAILNEIHGARRKAAHEIYNLNLEGKFPSHELQRQLAATTLKINAIDKLLSLREEHHRLSKLKEECKLRVITAINEDQDQQLYAQDMEDKDRATRRLYEIEKHIACLLVQAALATAEKSDISQGEYKTLHIGRESHTARSTTLVKSTQASQQRHLSLIPDTRPYVPNGSTATQYVQQTQTPIDMLQIPRKRPYEIQTYTSSPTKRDNNIYFSPSKHQTQRKGTDKLPQKANHEDAHRQKSLLEAVAKSSYIEDIEDEEAGFDSNMGADVHENFDSDEYGDTDDDMEDFEAAAQEAENLNDSSYHRSHEQRKVFAETSGNVIRSERPKAGSAFTQAPLQHSQMQHSWSGDVKGALKHRFHLRGFRPNQLEAINATLAGKDAFVLMPTGGGKSLCYQLPAIIDSGRTQGVTVVISPLLSLMQDQVEHLKKLNIQALLVNSEVTADHRRLVMGALKDPHPQKFCQLLYITPEMISKSQMMVSAFRDLWQRQRLARIVIDEAHCVSQWGHDFRPDYKLLGQVRQQFREVPVIALTATATENVKVDVIHSLGIPNCEVFTQSFNRPNLSYEVRSKTKAKEVLESIATTINTSYRGQSGIIYCLSKKNCENVATKLRDQYSIIAHHYHAGMESEEKKSVQKRWQAGEFHVIVATIAFGMGIDKPDVRFVIHHTIPKSLEGYYQETGRAGRDGKRSGCFLYYGYQDTSMIKRMIDDGEGSYDQKDRQRQMLRKVIQFCENKSDCRRVQVLHYFNEAFDREDCRGCCDNCNSKSTFETRDYSEYAIAALSMVRRIENDKVTLLHCVDVFRGSKTKKITELNHDQLQEHGVGADIDRGNVERLFYRLLSEDALAEHNSVNKAGFAQQYIHVGKNSYDFSQGRRKLKIQIRMSPNGKSRAILKAPQKSYKRGSKKSGTGVAAAHPDYPASTNVSSPVQAATKRRMRQTMQATPEPDHYSNGYVQDGFVVGDDDESDAFEPVREKGKSRSLSKRPLGPPITIDERIANLPQIHQMVVEDFLITARQQCQKLLIDKNLRQNPFTDTMLREMAITFPEDEDQLLKISGITQDKVNRYGAQFLKLIKNAQRRYDDMMQQQYDDRPKDPNHQNVIDLISDDEAAIDDEFDDDLNLDDESQEEYSKFFRPSNEVHDFNATLQGLAPPAPTHKASSRSNEYKSSSANTGGRNNFKGRGGFGKGRRKASGSSSKGKGPTGVSKSKATSSRSSGNNFASGVTKRNTGGSSGNGGIGMMPV